MQEKKSLKSSVEFVIKSIFGNFTYSVLLIFLTFLTENIFKFQLQILIYRNEIMIFSFIPLLFISICLITNKFRTMYLNNRQFRFFAISVSVISISLLIFTLILNSSIVSKLIKLEVRSRARTSSEKNWSNIIYAKAGDTVDILISMKNSSTTVVKSVIIGDNLPPRVEYIPNTTILYNSNHDEGLILPDNLITGGVRIGSYGPWANAHIKFRIKLNKNLPKGSILENVGVARAEALTGEIYNINKIIITP